MVNIVFFIQIVNHLSTFLAVVTIHAQLQFTLFSTQHHGLAVHPAHHVKGRLGLAPKRHLKNILLNALCNGLFKFRTYLKVPVSWTEAPDALMRTLVVIISDP